MVVGISVGEVMRRAVVTLGKGSTVKKAAQIMAKANIGSIIVTQKGAVIGMLTEGDIIRRVVALGLDPSKVKIAKVMSHPVRTIEPALDIEDAVRIMRDLDIERLPVVKKGNLVGIITERDITRIEPALLALMREKGALERIPPKEREVAISGECELCGNYSDYLRNVNGRFLCEDCRGL